MKYKSAVEEATMSLWGKQKSILKYPQTVNRQHQILLSPRCRKVNKRNTIALSANRTRGPTMATLDFTTKPIVLSLCLLCFSCIVRSIDAICTAQSKIASHTAQNSSNRHHSSAIRMPLSCFIHHTYPLVVTSVMTLVTANSR